MSMSRRTVGVERRSSRTHRRPRRPRTQPASARRRHPPRHRGRLHRNLRVGKILARVRHDLLTLPPALPRVGLALRAQAHRPRFRAARPAHQRLPPAVALRQQHAGSTRSSVGTVSRISNVLRMLFSRSGTYPEATAPPISRAPSRATPLPWTRTASPPTPQSAPAAPARAWDVSCWWTSTSSWATPR